MLFLYKEILNVINDLKKNHLDDAKRKYKAKTDYNGYIKGETHTFENKYMEVIVDIEYHKEYPSVTYFEKGPLKEDLKKEIGNVKITLCPKQGCTDWRTYYAEDREVFEVIFPFVTEKIKEVREAFEALEKKKEDDAREQRRQTFLKLKQEFEPETVQET